jgi:glycosyltransferase involved in cell wall biosynthesis
MDVDTLKISLITCTYNPNVEIFERLIAAIANLNTKEVSVEWIVVDNNSAKAVEEQFDFTLLSMPVVHVIEIKPGLTQARIAGSKMAKGDWLLFFDDDNEPNNDYLISVANLIKKYNNVKCWGAGNIYVNFQDTKDSHWLQDYRSVYQERHIIGEIIQEAKVWNSNYPQGTGQVITKSLFDDYLIKVANGLYSLSDRKGQSLSSGGDVQIVLNVIKLGYKVGISDKLLLQHNIDAHKSTFKYLFKLIYGMASGAVLAHHQVFPSRLPDKITNKITNKIVLTIVTNYFRQFKFKAFSREKLLIFSQRMGDLNAYWIAFNSDIKKPKVLQIIEKYVF